MEATEIQQHEIAEIEEFANKRDSMLAEIRKVIVGQDHVIEEVLLALFAKGHCLLVGVPGLAKTLLVSTIARIVQLSFRRIQFTPDLLPSDITGTDVLQEDPESGRRLFQFMQVDIYPRNRVALVGQQVAQKTVPASHFEHIQAGSFFSAIAQEPADALLPHLP